MAMLLAIVMSVFAAALVYGSWRQGRRAWAAAGWLAAFGSVVPWSFALGAEIGTCYAIMVFVCLVWTEVAWHREPARAGANSGRRPFQSLHHPTPRRALWHGALFLLSVPGAGIVALMLSVALVLHLSWSMPVKVAVAIFLFPVAWGGLSAWMCAQANLLRPTVASVGLAAICSLILFA